MNADGEAILACLRAVADERAARQGFELRVAEVKRFQRQRFAATYADLLANPRYTRAARFFLDELYGPGDFVSRDEQFSRIVPALVRMFPSEIVGTVLSLARLHALSEQLDTAMARSIDDEVNGSSYATAWRSVGRPDDRDRQVALMLDVGEALDRYTRSRFLGHTLRLMRAPARAAGLHALQTFLENGFEAFREMGGAAEFLSIVASRERSLSAALFAGGSLGTG